ncbi:GntP family transporter [Pseudokineococcus marinus]|uniref:GntP family transporter n=1 Tax=Pseudokineococcus marinus TaxID=351215 RepID=A0A849BNG6_9ACTN|nr:GntP family transporter [Pseudokineococcus marinus]NNH22587.1 GntP family transporter [Pseudokineococcus marinus]
MPEWSLPLIGAAGIALLLVLVIRFKVQAFAALLVTALLVGLVAGLPLATVPAEGDAPEQLGVVPAIIAGMGGTLGSVAILVALGAMIGKIIELSGGAESLAGRFAHLLGPRRVAGALTAAAGVLAIPVFFDVGFIILVPIIYGFCKATGVSPVRYGLPVAGLMLAVHVSVPPHPGVVGGAAVLGADVGWVTVLGIAICVPVGVVAHLLSKRINRDDMEMLPATREQFESFGTTGAASGTTAVAGQGAGSTAVAERTATGGSSEGSASGSAGGLAPGERAPGAGTVLAIILVPLFLIMLGTVGATLLPEGDQLRAVAGLVGAPVVALLVALALAGYLLGVRRGWSAQRLGEVMESSLPPAAVVILVTGAGGAFARVLTESGVGGSVSDLLTSLGLPLLLAGYLLALALRAAQGSATVALITSAGLVAGAATEAGLGVAHTALLTLALGFGSLGLSHINDSGFWVVTRYLGMSVADGLRRWTLLTTVLSLVGFGVVALLWAVVPG